MPTGYTEAVATGKITDFNEYALLCARAFGACILLRDEPLDSNIPEFAPSEHYAASLAEAENELAEFEAMNESQRRQLHADEHAKNVETADRWIAENLAQRERYEAMLSKAKAFKSPSPDHDKYAEFLVEQLESSIKFDCGTEYYENLKREMPFSEWQSKKRETLLRTVAYREQSNREEIARTASRNTWVRKLKDALGVK